MAVKKRSDDEQVHCNKCQDKTLHQLVREIKGDGGSEEWEPGFTYDWQTTYAVLQCRGCREVLLRRTDANTEDEYPSVWYFPPRILRRPPHWRRNLPGEHMLLLDEIYESLDIGNSTLPMMGARTIVDLVMRDKVGDSGTFKQKLEQLQKKEFISGMNRKVLEAALNAGNAAAHRAYSPTKRHVQAVMDIVENLLEAVYVLPTVADELMKTTPARPKPKSS
jgi:hypothetical protein